MLESDFVALKEYTVPNSYISPDMRAAVGREYRRLVSFPVSASDIRKWALAVYYPQQPPPKFWDESVARTGRHGGIVAPEDFNPFAWMTAPGSTDESEHDPYAADLTEDLLGIAGPGLKFQLNGGVQLEHGEPIRPGDVITASSTVAEYKERKGKLGQMLFTTLQDEWTNQDGTLVRRSRLNLIRY